MLTTLSMIDDWPVDNAATAVIAADGRVLDTHGDVTRRFRLASVTKLLTAYASLIAVEEGAFELDDPAGPPESTVRHLLAHASGLDFGEEKVRAEPGARRIYSNVGFEVLAAALETATDIPFPEYLAEAVFEPLGMSASSLEGSPAAGGVSTVADLSRFAAELQRPTLVSAGLVAEATGVVYPGLDGVLPGYGAQRPNDWGLGFEHRSHKAPHWTGATSSPDTFGHFGQSGTFLWVDPRASVACVTLTDRDFGPWAQPLWPAFTDAVLGEVASGTVA